MQQDVRITPPQAEPAPAAAQIEPKPLLTRVHPSVLVVLPAYNEAGLIEGTFRRVEVFARRHHHYTFLFVDDGSTDSTKDLLTRLVAEAGTEQVKLLSYSPNRGKGGAVRSGFEGAGQDIVLFTDSDLAYALEHLPRLVSALERAEVAIGSRSLIPRQESVVPLGRKIMGGAFNRLTRVMLGMSHPDTQAGLKGFRRDAAREIFKRLRLTGFAFDVELVFIAEHLGYRVAEIPARVSKRHNAKATKVSLFRDPMRMFMALLSIRVNHWLGRYA